MDHFSKSALEKYITCGEAYRRRYVLKESAPTSSNLVFGIAFHRALENFITNNSAMATWPKPDIHAIWEEVYDDTVRQFETILFEASTPAQEKALGHRMFSDEIMEEVSTLRPRDYVMSDEEGDHLMPAVEMELIFTVPGVAVPFVGYVDFVGVDGVPVDFKTAARKWQADKAQKELQPAFYLYGLAQNGMPSPDNTFRHMVFTKGTNPTLTTIETHRTEQEIQWALTTAASAYQGITAGVFLRNPLAWSCSPQYCEFYDTCMRCENG